MFAVSETRAMKGAGRSGRERAAAALEGLLTAAGLAADAVVDCRRMGTDAAMVNAIIERIASGEKSMTFSLPWLAAREGRSDPVPGDLVAVLDARGAPRLLLRLHRVRRLAFAEIGVEDIAGEGLPLRDLDAWRTLHLTVWNAKLAPYGLEVSDDMPVWAEYFELLAATEKRAGQGT
jgi:uncharacterized protein YhfF